MPDALEAMTMTARRLALLEWPFVGRDEELVSVRDALVGGWREGAVIWGPAGVGKTRLAEGVAVDVESMGRRVIYVTASTSAATVPFGALVSLLPAGVGGGPFDPLALFETVASELRASARGGPVVLLVDDLHLLDRSSAVLAGQLVTAGVVVLLATARSGEPLPDWVSALHRSGRLLGVDLCDLSSEDVDTLLSKALDGPVSVGTVADVWATSRGNPLFVRELVLGAQSAGMFVDDNGVWRLVDAAPPTTARLIDTVEGRLPPVGDPGRVVVELLAVAEPVEVAALEERVGSHVLEALERASAIRVRMDGRRRQARLAHPLYGEVLRARLPEQSRRRLLLEHADWIEHTGARRRDDALRMATARYEATGSGEPSQLLVAARLARYGHDFARVAQLARAALQAAPSAESHLLLGEALYEDGCSSDAEDVLAAAEAIIDDERFLVPIHTMRVFNLAGRLARPGDALELTDAIRDRVSHSDGKLELIVDQAIALVMDGQSAAARRALKSVPDAAPARVRVLRTIAEVPALIHAGMCEVALALSRSGYTEHVQLGDQIAVPHPGIHVRNQVAALIEAGRLDSARRLAETCYEHATRAASPHGRIWFALLLGRSALLAGHPRTAHRWFAEVAGLSRDMWLGARRVALASMAMTSAWLGDPATARTHVDELDRLPEFGHLRVEQELGRAWALAGIGFPHDARDVLLAAADRAAGSGQHSSEAWLLHDVARLGDPSRVAGRLEQLAAFCEGRLVAAYAMHATAAARRDGTALTDACDQFADIGATLLAAEAATAAAHAFQRQGFARAASAMRARAASLAADCEGARTPGLLTPATVVPLTAREREITSLAAQGLPSSDIAARCHLSVRTVHSHLHNAYAKLGITNRRQLAAALQGSGSSRDVA